MDVKLTEKAMSKGFGALTPEEQRQYIDENLTLVMGMSNPIKNVSSLYKNLPSALDEGVTFQKLIKRALNSTPEDTAILDEFIDRVRSGKAKSNMGQLGVDVANIMKGYGINSAISNDRAANIFDRVLNIIDKPKVL